METEIEKTVTEKQLVVFDLDDGEYGVDIDEVKEIIGMQDITRVPRTPEFVEGVINLRGKVNPVVDLRKRLSLPVPERTDANRIVVVDIGDQDLGFIVDAVTEVLRIPSDSIEPPTQVITNGDSEYLMGIVKLSNRLIILVDLTRVLSHTEQSSIGDLALALAA